MKRISVHSLASHAYAVETNDGRHTWPADEPLEDGGDDFGPSPYELLLSALGGCMAITARLYAARKGWPLAAVDVALTHEKVLARDYAGATPDDLAAASPNGRLDVITASVRLTGDLTAEQTARLLEVTQRCPVHKTLERGTRIVTSLDGIATPP